MGSAGRRPINTSAPTASSGTSARVHTGAFVPLSLWGCVRSSPCPQPQVGGVARAQMPFMDGLC